MDRKAETRRVWLETMAKYRRDFERPGSAKYWSPSLECASRDELRAIQNAKIAAVTPFLYENSEFYRTRFDRLGLLPTDIRNVGDLAKWPVVDKKEMVEDVLANPPWGTYSTHDDALWHERGWMMFASSGTTGAPRPFRYSRIDHDYWVWANARALYSFGVRKGEVVLIASGYGPHVWAWGVQYALTHMGIAVIPCGGMDAKMRANMILRFKPTVLACTPSYLLHLGRVMQEMGHDPAATSVKTIFSGGEPAAGIPSTRKRIEELWGANFVEFYGCTEAAPHSGGFSCEASALPGKTMHTHLMEDVQVWELIDPESRQPVKEGARGITVCTNLNSESSPQLRFLVGDYTVYDTARCACGRTHVRALGGFQGRADDLLTLRGIKFYPSVVEEGVRSVAGIGDEYQIVLSRMEDGMDVMKLRVEHPNHAEAGAGIAAKVESEVRARIELRSEVEVLAPGTLPKTEFKAKRVFDNRPKT
ncbi:MAG: phenylacetate--CoA ligase family protein [Alphaproteobacteria bacterium]